MNEPMQQFEASDVAKVIQGMPSIEQVRRLENLLLMLPQIDLQTQHIIHGEVSARWGLIPKGCSMTGAITNRDNICVLFGDITVTTDDGPRRLIGFHVLAAQAGAKRVGDANEDTWWATLHHTKLTDIREIEDEMTDESARLLTRRPKLASTTLDLIEIGG